MELVRINDVVEDFAVSSRTLRYYEQVGLLWSERPGGSGQRYYDAAALERLRQILVLRKLQIPIKDIVAVFADSGTAALIGAFVRKLEALDNEITALGELRNLVDDFLQQMLASGITKISAITLLYEETEKRLAATTKDKELSFERLAKVSQGAQRLHGVRLLRLPPMRMLTSRLQTGAIEPLDGHKMQNLFAPWGLLPTPGLRDCFYRQEQGDEWLMLLRIPPDFVNTTPYREEQLAGGLYAVASCFMEGLDDTFRLLREWVMENDMVGPDANGLAPRREMIEELLPWDIANRQQRYQQDVFVPVQILNGGEDENDGGVT